MFSEDFIKSQPVRLLLIHFMPQRYLLKYFPRMPLMSSINILLERPQPLTPRKTAMLLLLYYLSLSPYAPLNCNITLGSSNASSDASSSDEVLSPQPAPLRLQKVQC